MLFVKKITPIIMFFLYAAPAHALELPACTKTDGNCQLNDMVNMLIVAAEFILGVTGSLALLMFVYGGFLWVTSFGKEERITKGKTAVTNAVIGLAIVFLAYGIIQFAISAFGIQQEFTIEAIKKGGSIKQ